MFKHELTARTEVNLNEIIQQVISVATGPMRSNGVRLETNLTGAVMPLVMADPVQLQQVILNLVMNAIESMGHSGDEMRVLRLRTEPKSRRDHCGESYRLWPARRSRSRQKNVSAVFHHEIWRDGNGTFNLQDDCRSARRAADGGCEQTSRNGISDQFAAPSANIGIPLHVADRTPRCPLLALSGHVARLGWH